MNRWLGAAATSTTAGRSLPPTAATTSATATTAAPNLSRAAVAPPRRAMISTSRLRRPLLCRGGGRMEWGRCDAVTLCVGLLDVNVRRRVTRSCTRRNVDSDRQAGRQAGRQADIQTGMGALDSSSWRRYIHAIYLPSRPTPHPFFLRASFLLGLQIRMTKRWGSLRDARLA